MIFHFNGKATPQTLLSELEPFVQILIDAGVTHLTRMHVSALCFDKDGECLIMDQEGIVSQMYFDRVGDGERASESRELRDDGSKIVQRPKDMPHGGLGVLFNHND